MEHPLIDLSHIWKSYDGDLILDDLSLSVKENSFVDVYKRQVYVCAGGSAAVNKRDT